MELLGPVRSWPLSTSSDPGGPVTPTRNSGQRNAVHTSTTASAPSIRRIWSNENPEKDVMSQINPVVIINPYQVLQIRKDATNQEIRHAYRRLALWHHPGRVLQQGRRRRRQRDDMFLVLAACCETLLERESRSRCDALLLLQQQRLQTQTPLPFSTVTRTPRANNRHPHSLQQQQKEHDANSSFTCRVLPFLARTFSDSSAEDNGYPARGNNNTNNNVLAVQMRLVRKSSILSNPSTPPLLWTESAEGGSKDNYNNTLDDTSTIASGSFEEIHHQSIMLWSDEGGPLSLLYQARNGRPFSDPYQFFERIFGYPVFPRQEHNRKLQHHGLKDLTMPQPGWSVVTNSHHSVSHDSKSSSSITMASRNVHRKAASSSWTGSAQILPDGSRVHTTTRIINNRRLVKTEVWKVDPKTGQSQASITVTGEDIEEDSKSSTTSSSESDIKEDSKKTNCSFGPHGKESNTSSSCCWWTDAGCSTWNMGWCGGATALKSIHDDDAQGEYRDYHHYYAHQKRKEQSTKSPPRTPTRSRRQLETEENPVLPSHLARLACVAW